ncbi:MAG: tetratricopeptide repeat protein, partial [Bacteriovoracaceae bacterium]|nr:tetratricopeptide repeat protein [Bacteriovoracaceae bacterium]
YQQAMKHFPSSESTCGMAIEAYEQAHKLNEAAQVALDCQKRMPTAVFAYYRGRIALAQDKTALGIKYLEQALKIDPRYRPAALVLGLLAEQEGNYARAKKIYLEFLRHDESNLVILGRLVQIYFNEQDYKSALPWAERMANLDAEDLSLKLKLAILYLDLRQIDDARSILQEILAAIPDSDKAWYYLGAAEVLAAHEAAAFSAWAKIGEESSLFAQARLQQAQILWAKLKQAATPENEAAFLDFLALNENHPKIEADFKLMHAAYAQEKGDSALALAILRQLEREQKLDMDGQYYFMVLLQENKATEEALEIGRKLLAKHPDHAHALNFVGYALLEDQNKFDEAYTYLQRAINLAPDDYYIRDSLAWYYYRTANYGQAAREIKTALAAAPEDAALNHHAALIAVSLQQKEQACRYFQKAWQAGKEELRSEIAGQVEICSNFSFADHPAERPDPAATAAAAVSFPVVTNDALASPEEESRDQGDRERSVDVNVARPSVSTTDAEISADGPPAAASVVVPPPPSAPASSTTTTEGPNPAREQGAKAFPDSLLPDDPILLDPQDN